LGGKYSQDFIMQIMQYGLSMVSGICVGAYVARYLGADSLGIISLFLAITTILCALNDIGTNQILIRCFADPQNESNIFWSLLIKIRFPLAIITSVIVFFLLKNDHVGNLASISSGVIIIGLIPIFLAPFTQFKQILIARVKNKELAIGGIAILAIFCCLRICCVILDLGIESFIITNSIISIFSLVNIITITKKNKFLPPIHFSTQKELVQGLILAAPLALGAISSILYSKIDLFMISSMLIPAAVGHYAVSTRLHEILIQIPGSLNQTFKGPLYNRLKLASVEEYRLICKSAFEIATIFGYLIMAISIIGGIVMIPIIYGETFRPSAEAFAIRIVSLPLIAQWFIKTNILVHEKSTKIIFKATLLGLIINILANVFLIPRYGINGAAASTLISQIFTVIISSFLFGSKLMFQDQINSLTPKFSSLSHNIYILRKNNPNNHEM